MSEPLNIPGYLDLNVDLMAESGSDGSISRSCSSFTKSSDVQIEQMSPDDLAEFFVDSLPQYRSVMTVLADFTRSYRMDGKAFLAISRDDIETLLEVQTPSVVDALTKLQGAATGQRQLKRRPKLRLSAVFSDLEDEILSARATDVDEGKQHGITALGEHDGPWVFSDEHMPLTDDGVLFSGITGVPVEEDRPVSPSDSASTPSSSRNVPIIFDTSPDMTISPSTLISPQAILNSGDAEFLATLGGHTYPDMPKQKREESQITDAAGLELIPIDETLSYDRPIETHDATARNGSSVPETESFERGETTYLGTDVDRCVGVSQAETNYNGSLPGGIGPDRLRVSGGQEAHIMKANAEAGQITPSTLSSHDQFSSTLKNDSNHEYSWLALSVEASNNNDKPRQEQSLSFSPTSDDKYNSSLDRCEYYVLDNSPDSGAVDQHALVISEHGSQDPPNQSLSLSDIGEQIKRNSLSSYKSDGLANAAVFNDPPRSFDSSLLTPPSSHNPSDVQYVSNTRTAASDPCDHCAPKGTDKSPVTISSPGIDAGGRTSQRPSPETLSTHVTRIAGDIVSRFDAAKIDATIPPIAADAGIIGVRSTENMPHGLCGTADSQQMPPKLKVTNSSFYSPDTSSQLNIDQIAEDPSEKDNVAPMRRSFSASTGDISLELGSWIVVPGLSAEESHRTPPSDVYPAPAIPPIDALSYTSAENGGFSSRLAADTSFTAQIQALPEIPHVPLFYDGELELGFTTPTVRTRGLVKEFAFSSHKWETDERPFFGQSHGSSSFFEQRKSKSGKGQGKKRKDTAYQDKVVQTDTAPVDPYVEDPRIVQLSRKMNRLQKEMATLKVENEKLKKQTLWSKLFSRPPVKEPSVRMTLDNEPDVMRIPPFPDLRFVTM
ncbi:uncharacterized protein EV420DRAFT_1634740 [Desarmillaria tabescens]|uniref:SAM domain-containing protein n=1 Tax=Armillaria tabescens TaxID=1929756 RepID=A0AA39TYT3_ARMTA|nr:uncharacterized protein EV420DRAFT_1634740 [Desarmillaria tabescens]KAK0470308.1 hypothetical protein EV420DRAFT_1634740 [Desarmillaria tabescens]